MTAGTFLGFGRARSFQARLLLLAVLTGAFAALLVGATLVTAHQFNIRAMVEEQLDSQGEVIAFNIAGPLLFELPDEAVDVLESLQAVDHVTAAHVFDAEGILFASRDLHAGRELPLVATTTRGLHRNDGWFVHATPIVLDEARLGTLVLVYDPSWMTQRLWLNLAAALLITALATLAAVLLARRIQEALARPIQEIIGTSRVVSETGNYALSARRFDDDELGELTDAFNTMLARIAKQAAEVNRAHEQFQVAVEASPQGMAMVDRDGRIILVNHTMEQIFGYTREELLGQPIETLVPERFRELHQGYRQRFHEDPQARAMGADRDLWGLRKDGSEFPVEIGLNPIPTAQGLRVLSSIVDITERKRAAAALRDREQRLHTLTNAVPAFVWSSDATGRVMEMNDRWYEYTGFDRARLPDEVSRLAMHPEERERVNRLWRQAASSGTPFETEFRIRRHDGRYRWFLARAVPLRDEKGGIAGWFGTSTDIEDRKRAETERDELLKSERAARSEAERASRLKDEFVATLSHELRTPLAAILGWTHIVKKEAGDSPHLAEALDTIERNARAQSQMIEDLLDMSRIVSGKIRLDVQLVELPEVIDAAIATVRPAADSKGIRLQRIIDTRVAPVRGDAGRLQQIVWNLLSNAVKFTPRGGRIQVALQRINSHIEISVSDTGEGIEPEFLPHLFERFRQANASSTRVHSGLGIGLALVKHLSELHGGSVSATSPGRGQGATFTVMLPLAIAHSRTTDDRERVHPAAHRTAPAVAPFQLQATRVLVIEDETDARVFIQRLLESAEATVLATDSAASALDEVAQFKPDVIVSDIGMPHMDGYQFMRELRRKPAAEGGRTPAVALTAFARSEDRTRALMAGYQMHVVKPVEASELLAAIASLASLKTQEDLGV